MSKNQPLRVTQVNAIYLDSEINRIFQQFVQDISKNLPLGFTAPYEPEINLLVRIAVLNYSIVKSGSTFGQQLLSLKYDNFNKFKGYMFIVAQILDYVKYKMEIWKPSHEANNQISMIYFILKMFDFVNLSVFLRNGTKPQLIERFLGINHVYATDNVQRQYDSKYLARELLWNGFIEILVHILPLINYHKIKRTFRNYNPFYRRPIYTSITTRVMTVNSKCAYCGQNPVLPYHMGCAHVFCYVCLKGNQAADAKYECPVCDHRNPNILCDRVTM